MRGLFPAPVTSFPLKLLSSPKLPVQGVIQIKKKKKKKKRKSFVLFVEKKKKKKKI
jgi:hypothetical protein